MDHNNASILATICYSDVFDYPLTKAELWRYYIQMSHERPRIADIEKSLQRLLKAKKIGYKSGYYFLKGKSDLVAERIKRQKISNKKFAKAKEIVSLLRIIPTIQCIGVSGSLAMYNAQKDADIDIFLITKQNTLWITRLVVLCVLQIKKVRRKRDAKKTQDTVCVNMLMDMLHVAFPKSRQDIYTAHEIMQMKPLFSRGFTYEVFLQHNTWITKFLLNSFPKTALQKLGTKKEKVTSWVQIFEPFAQYVQLFFIKRHLTTETISRGFVAFHPFDYRKNVLDAWEKRKQKYGI